MRRWRRWYRPGWLASPADSGLFLKRIEDILREKTGAGPGFRLSDCDDLIGGTSTGSVIAAALSLGMSVDEVRTRCLRPGQEVFKPGLKSVYGERTLGPNDFKTGQMMMSKRLDTNSPGR